MFVLANLGLKVFKKKRINVLISIEKLKLSAVERERGIKREREREISKDHLVR